MLSVAVNGTIDKIGTRAIHLRVKTTHNQSHWECHYRAMSYEAPIAHVKRMKVAFVWENFSGYARCGPKRSYAGWSGSRAHDRPTERRRGALAGHGRR